MSAKPSKPTAVVVTSEQPKDPTWDVIRETASQVRSVGRLFIRGQVRLGMLLLAQKKKLGIRAGKGVSTSADSAKVVPWAELVTIETGYSRRQADEFIRLFEATTAKLKKAKKLTLPAAVKKDALVLFNGTDALSLTAEQWEMVDDVIATLTTGETQASLMEELGMVAKPAKMPVKTGGKEKGNEPTVGELAFHFFDGVASPLINARTNPDYKMMLLALPLHSDPEHPLSLATLEAEFRAALADVEDAKQASAKPARGRTINS